MHLPLQLPLKAFCGSILSFFNAYSENFIEVFALLYNSNLNASSFEPDKTAFLTGTTLICCRDFQNTTADCKSDDCSCKRQTTTNSEYSKTCVKRALSKRPKNGFQDQYRLKQVKCIAECSFCNTFDLH